MSDLTDPAYLVVLLHAYGQAHARQYARPTDEGNQALGDAARAIYAYTDAREAAARADERAKVSEEIAALERKLKFAELRTRAAGRSARFAEAGEAEADARVKRLEADLADAEARWARHRVDCPAPIRPKHAGNGPSVAVGATEPGGGSATKDDTRDDRQEGQT